MTELGDPLVDRPAVAQPVARNTPSIDLDALYRAHCVRFVRLATAITLDRAVAEEVVHDAFASLQLLSPGNTTIHATARDQNGVIVGTADMRVTVTEAPQESTVSSTMPRLDRTPQP